MKLEKIELCGLQGKTLLKNVNSIYEEFFKMFTELSGAEYELLTPEDEGFTKDVEEILTKVFFFLLIKNPRIVIRLSD